MKFQEVLDKIKGSYIAKRQFWDYNAIYYWDKYKKEVIRAYIEPETKAFKKIPISKLDLKELAEDLQANDWIVINTSTKPEKTYTLKDLINSETPFKCVKRKEWLEYKYLRKVAINNNEASLVYSYGSDYHDCSLYYIHGLLLATSGKFTIYACDIMADDWIIVE